MNNNVSTNKPQRSDSLFISDTLKAFFNARIGLFVVSIVSIASIIAIIYLVSQPQRVVVIDASSGKTYYAVNRASVSLELVDRQLCYYSAQFCENFYNNDYMTIESARKRVVDLMATSLRDSIEKKWNASPDLRLCLDKKQSSYFAWEINPSVTMRNDPYYTTWCVFERIIKENEMLRETKKYHIILKWGRTANNADYRTRPHSLVLMSFVIVNEGSAEYNDQINKLR
jgi:hypothetical protein